MFTFQSIIMQSHRVFSECFRLDVVSDYYDCGCPSKAVFCRKWDISPTNLNRWLQKYFISNVSLSLSSKERLEYMDEKKVEIPESRIEQLEKALATLQLKNKALETMIDIAEEAEGISIRKNTGAKQSAHCTKNRKAKKR